jgi:predicted PurR-regulated permease PerM
MRERTTSRSYLQRALTAVGLLVLALIVLYLLLYLAHVLLLVFAGALVSVFLGGVARYLSEHTPLSRPPALLLVIAALLGIGIGLTAAAGPRVVNQAVQLADRLPDALRRLQMIIQEHAWSRQLLAEAPALRDLIPAPTDVISSITNVFSQTLGAVTRVLIVLLIGIYGAVNPQGYVQSVVMLIPKTDRPRAREVMHALGRVLRWWLVGRFVSMSIVGAVTTTGLWIIGVPSPLALGLIAAVLEFVPYIGPLLAAAPALLVALVLSAEKLAYVAALYAIVQLLESYLINPLVQERAVSILPAALITAQVIMGVLAGPTGIALATPLAVSTIVLVQMLYIEDVLGDSVKVLGTHPERQRVRS